MRDWKYVMIRVGDNLYPILFPQELVHADMAHATLRVVANDRDMRKFGPASVHSAGFVSGLDIVAAGGESESLGIKSDPEDTTRIKIDMLRHLDPAPLPINSAADGPTDYTNRGARFGMENPPPDFNALAERVHRRADRGEDPTEPERFDPNAGRIRPNYGDHNRSMTYSQKQEERRRIKRLNDRKK